MTDFGTIPEYASYIAKDPFRLGLHYPAVVSEIGDVRAKHVLDIGTGDGLFPRLLAAQGAFVVGYDKAPEKIAEARHHADARRLGVEYFVATPQTYASDRRFDAATSVMVLAYAADVADLASFFESARRHLRAGAKFVSVTLNPLFTQYGTNLIVRRISRLEGNQVKVEFLEATGEPGLQQPLIARQYTDSEYEQAAAEAGMTVAWKTLTAPPAAVAEKGEEFWRPCHEARPYVLLIAQARS